MADHIPHGPHRQDAHGQIDDILHTVSSQPQEQTCPPDRPAARPDRRHPICQAMEASVHRWSSSPCGSWLRPPRRGCRAARTPERSRRPPGSERCRTAPRRWPRRWRSGRSRRTCSWRIPPPPWRSGRTAGPPPPARCRSPGAETGAATGAQRSPAGSPGLVADHGEASASKPKVCRNQSSTLMARIRVPACTRKPRTFSHTWSRDVFQCGQAVRGQLQHKGGGLAFEDNSFEDEAATEWRNTSADDVERKDHQPAISGEKGARSAGRRPAAAPSRT